METLRALQAPDEAASDSEARAVPCSSCCRQEIPDRWNTICSAVHYRVVCHQCERAQAITSWSCCADTMIIVSLTGPTLPDVLRQIRASRPFADLFEFRLDLIEASDRTPVLSFRSAPVYRYLSSGVGGRCIPRRGKRKRLALLELLVRAGAAYVDVEFRAGRRRLDRLRSVLDALAYRLIPPSRGEGSRSGPIVQNAARLQGRMLSRWRLSRHDSYQNALAFDFLDARTAGSPEGGCHCHGRSRRAQQDSVQRSSGAGAPTLPPKTAGALPRDRFVRASSNGSTAPTS